VIEPQEYKKLIAQESLHWGGVEKDPENPQIWHDPDLFDIFFGKEYHRLLDRASSGGPRILDLGCGEGRLSIELAARGMDVTGIDLSEERIRRATAMARSAMLGVQPRFVSGDLNTIALPANSFDCVVAHDSLHHILHLERLCNEVEKALKPGGSFLIMDYVGMGIVRKLLAGALYGILPTYQPYRKKWRLRSRLGAFLATEKQKRHNLQDASGALHHDSPFEEISQGSIIKEIRRSVRINELETYCPFWFYLAAKIRLPAGWKRSFARTLRACDDLIVKSRLAQGAYVWIAAQKPTTH
jgi:SAM-dependent methyltransferase